MFKICRTLIFLILSSPLYSAPVNTVHIITPSFGYTQKALKKSRNILQKAGFTVNSPSLIHKENYAIRQPAQRLTHVQNALNGNANVLWFFRGGCGLDDIIFNLPPSCPMHQKPKIITGFSDATNLHLFMERYWKWPFIHAPVLAFNKENAHKTNKNSSLAPVFKLLRGPQKLTYNVTALNTSSATINGRLVGGNLSIIASKCGTNLQLNTKDSILFLEETGESIFRIRRYLVQLHQSGLFQNLKAIFIGNTGIAHAKDVAAAIQTLAPNLPIFHSPDFGHGPQNYPLVLGQNATISKSSSGWQLTQNVSLPKLLNSSQ